MPVYVDPLMTCLRNANWPYTQSCHMFADSDNELHAMAARLGLKHTWFQTPKPKAPDCVPFAHYDLHKNKRAQAVALGVIELDRRAAVAKWVQRKYLPDKWLEK